MRRSPTRSPAVRKWTAFANFEDEVTDLELDGDDLYVLVNKGTPRGRLVKTSAAAPNLATAATVVCRKVPMSSKAPCGRATASTCASWTAASAACASWITTAASPRSRCPSTARSVRSTPRQSEDGALMSLSGWLTPTGIYSVDAAGSIADTGITPKPAIDVSAYAGQALLRRRQGRHQNSLHPDLPQGPEARRPRAGLDLRLRLLRRCRPTRRPSPAAPWRWSMPAPSSVTPMCAAAANTAANGTRPGSSTNKPNTWRDLIAVCEELCTKKYTSPQHLAIGGRSAGGITVGRAMTERPDLFAAVIDGVGWSNPLRYIGRTRRLWRRTRMGRHHRSQRLSRLEEHRQLSSGEGRHRLSRGAAHHRRHRPAGRSLTMWRR